MRHHRELWLPEAEAQAATLIRAVEDADREGDLLSGDVRRETASEARESSRRDEVERWIGRRALALTTLLQERLPSLPSILRMTRLGRGLAVPVLVVAFVAGLATNALGPSQRIQVLAIPLLGLIAWNLASLLLLLVRGWLLRFVLPQDGRPRALALLEGLVRRSLKRHLPAESTGSKSGGAGRAGDAAGDGEVIRRALASFLEHWFPAVAPLAAARLRRVLHASALVLVAGVVAGMYLRGLAWEYRVTWESTFLSAAQVEAFLGWLLAPAVAVLGADWPPDPLTAIQSPPYGRAAPWIHLYAVTAGLFVGVPRLLLVLWESFRCRRLERRLELSLPESYLRKLTAATVKKGLRVDVIPYSHRPGGRTFESLKRLLVDFFGPRCDVRLGKTLDYGAEIADLEQALAIGETSCCVLLFPLSQTPELEVHGELLGAWKKRLAGGPSLLALVDGSGYRQRLGVTEDDDRLVGRRKSWDRIFGDAQLTPVHLDLGTAVPDDTLNRLASAGWPPDSLGGAP